MDQGAVVLGVDGLRADRKHQIAPFLQGPDAVERAPLVPPDECEGAQEQHQADDDSGNGIGDPLAPGSPGHFTELVRHDALSSGLHGVETRILCYTDFS